MFFSIANLIKENLLQKKKKKKKKSHMYTVRPSLICLYYKVSFCHVNNIFLFWLFLTLISLTTIFHCGLAARKIGTNMKSWVDRMHLSVSHVEIFLSLYQ